MKGICMVVQDTIHVLARAVIIQENHILVCHTQDLAHNFYFLPGGHVEYEENAEAAVLRELKEEGNISGTIKRFLGCLEFSFEPGQNSKCHNHEYNLYFEVMVEPFYLHKEIPQLEPHIKLAWVPLEKVAMLDFRPEPLKAILPSWLNQNLRGAFMSHMANVKKL